MYACGGAAVVIAVTAVLNRKGMGMAAWAGLLLAFLLLAYGGKTVFSLLRDIDGNAAQLVIDRAKKSEVITPEAAQRTIVYKAGIFAAMTAFSLNAFLRLGLALRRGKEA